MEKAILRVLIVDDFEPWRNFLLSTLQKLPQFRVIGEESDGLSAVHRAEQFKPDLIVLDIGLPKLNGIEAGRRIRKISPDSRILFASADRSRETVEAALETGAGGYLVKTDAGSELLPAIEAVLQGRRFVSPSLAGEPVAAKQSRDGVEHDAEPLPQNGRARHEVDFYRDDIALVNGFCRSIGAALQVSAAAVVIATASHHTQILERLASNGVDINAAIERGRYLRLNAADALEMFMVDEMPDEGRCRKALTDLIATIGRKETGQDGRVAVCGEGARILLEQGNVEAAIQLEHIWDKVAGQRGADTLCGFLWSAFPEGENSPVFRGICAEHSEVHGRHPDDEGMS